MIEVQNLSKYFKGKVALDNVSLSFPAEQTHVLLGTSGCGKSTLLRCLLGLISVDAGTIRLDGVSVSTNTQKEIAFRTGYVIQKGSLFPHLSAKNNITLAVRLRGWEPERIEKRLAELCELVHLSPALIAKFPNELSGGQQQRAALARALMADPPYLFMDEPLGALDPITRFKLQEELKSIFSTLNKTVILVTHDVTEAAHFGDSISLLNKGKLIQSGKINDLLESPATPYVRKFFSAHRELPSS